MVNKLMRFCCHFWLSLCDARLMNTLNGILPWYVRIYYFSSTAPPNPCPIKPFSSYALHAFCHILTYFCGVPQPGTVRSPQSTVRIVHGNRHIWCQLERDREREIRRPFYFPQPPHYRHSYITYVCRIHWPSPLWSRRVNEKSSGIFWGTRRQRSLHDKLLTVSFNCACCPAHSPLSLTHTLFKCPFIL